MDDVIVISLSDESEEDEQLWKRKKSRRQRGKRPRSASPSQDIIDLTGNYVFPYVTSSEIIIDLTGNDEDTSHGTPQQQMTSEIKYDNLSLSEGGSSEPENEVMFSSPMKVETSSSNEIDTDDKSSDSVCSSICSMESITDLCQPDGLPERTDADLPSRNKGKCAYVNSSHLQDWSHQATHNQDGVHSDIVTQVQHISSSTPTSITAMKEESPCSQSTLLNRSLLYKLRYFKKPLVGHMFPHTLRHDKNSPPLPIPLSRMNMINTTKDENFHPGTLYFLSEFVSASQYPPKEIISYVITSVLLGAEEQPIRQEAYMILMKVQRLHPATSESVAWDWNLLSEVMSGQTGLLFLQYVVQTLDDDFHLCLQRRTLHKSLCKSMLSCDKSFCNVKQVIDWLIDAVKQIPETGQDSISQCNLQRVIFLLQRMLSIAVEVDHSPTMNSIRIADYIFSYMSILKTRPQREMFFSSTENILLRAKILEVIFNHSCKSLPELPLCFGKIIHFISNSTPQLKNQGPEWQRWDEMLHQLIVLCLSFQTIITGHLRTPVIDRPDEILKKTPSVLHLSEDITESEVDLSLALLQQRMAGAGSATALLNRLFLLRSLLLTAVRR
ncbi:SUMO-interacting motif-containing protein 1 [Bufo bufo]|uniref:SUMO-interacting motif-containing protein 1 n=1 Tax=Bufo bufo TaxID=8384 RepID=UPI001ABE040A|nr:SUMO-interacting motif-containing protein 1 [Bufo bufo]